MGYGSTDITKFEYSKNLSAALIYLMIKQQVRQVDIFPTLYELIGASSDLGSINGRSLVPLLNKQSLTEEPTYIESGSASAKKLGKVIGIRTSNYKYLQNSRTLTKIFLFKVIQVCLLFLF